MNPKRMTPEREAVLANALQDMKSYISDGLHPTEALHKVAAAVDAKPGHIQLMARAYNIGMVNRRRKDEEDLFEKSAEFPLADAEAVVNRLFPSHVKTAAEEHAAVALSSDYVLTSWAKNAFLAGSEKVNPDILKGPKVPELPKYQDNAKRFFDLRKAAEFEASKLRVEELAAQKELEYKVAELNLYFRKAGSTPFSVVRDNAEAAWGKLAKDLFESLARESKDHTKSASAVKVEAIDLNRAPYKQISAALAAAEKLVRVREEGIKCAEELVSAVNNMDREFRPAAPGAPLDLDDLEMRPKVAARYSFNPPGSAPTPGSDTAINTPYIPVEDAEDSGIGRENKKDLNSLIDQMSFVGGLNVGARGVFRPTTDLFGAINKRMDSVGTKDRFPAPAVNEAYVELNQPGQAAKLRKIETQVHLHNALANDPVISGYHPDEVVQAFNELQTLAPRAMSNPALMKAVLGKKLAQGRLDQYDLDQLQKAELNLKDREEPHRFTTSQDIMGRPASGSSEDK